MTTVHAMAKECDRLDDPTLQDDEHSAEAALDLSYRGLTAPAARLYRLLALHPGPDFGGAVAAAMLGGPGDRCKEASHLLDRLVGAGLLNGVAHDRYRFPGPVRAHARARAEAEEAPESRTAARRRIFDHYFATAARAERILDPHHRFLPHSFGPGPVVVDEIDGAGTALAWLEQEQANLLAVAELARRAGCPAVTWQLVDAMWSLFTRHKHYAHWRHAHEEGLAAARECGDTAAEARMLASGGLGELDTGGHARALAMFERAARLFRRDGDELGCARSQNYRGLALLGLGRLEEAERLFRHASTESPRCGDRRAGGLARLNLAEVAVATGRHEEAVEQAASAHGTLLEAGDTYNAARAATLLGRAHLGCGRPDAAEEHLTAAHEALRRMTAGYETARALEALAELAVAQDRRVLARDRYREALEVYETLRVPAADTVRARLNRLDGR